MTMSLAASGTGRFCWAAGLMLGSGDLAGSPTNTSPFRELVAPTAHQAEGTPSAEGTWTAFQGQVLVAGPGCVPGGSLIGKVDSFRFVPPRRSAPHACL